MIINGTVYADKLVGGNDDDSLYGGNSVDTLIGGAGNDWLDGGEWGDRMVGGIGDDVYVVDYGMDLTIEAAGEGTDLVFASVDWTLAVNVENLVMTGIAVAGTGNASDNTVYGNASDNVIRGLAGNDYLSSVDGNDTLYGGAGTDLLDGGAGNDTFVFDVAPGAANADVILNFSTADDMIKLLRGNFGGISSVNAGNFVVGTSAADAADRIIFDPASGNVYFDRDGTGGAYAQELFVTLVGVTDLTAADFSVAYV